MARMPSAPISCAWRASSIVSSTASALTWMVTGMRPLTTLDRRLGEQLALGDGQVERLALVMRPGDGGRAGADVEVEQPLEGRQVEAEIVLERRHRALHDASELGRHVFSVPIASGSVDTKLPASVRRGKALLGCLAGMLATAADKAQSSAEENTQASGRNAMRHYHVGRMHRCRRDHRGSSGLGSGQ